MKQLLLFFFLLATSTPAIIAQCDTWNESPQKDEAEEAHVLYRTAIKAKDFDGAFENWQKAFNIAPMADGKRNSHYKDGRAIYFHKMEKEADPTKKADYKSKVLALYDQEIECFGAKKEGYILGQKGYDMVYKLRTPYSESYQVLKKATELSGKQTLYTVLVPYAAAVVNLFTDEKVSKEEARNAYTLLNEIADHNIANNAKYGTYYTQSKESMNNQFSAIQYHIFDCAYFKEKLEPAYRADPTNRELYRDLYKKLVQGGCDKSDPLLAEIASKDNSFIDGEKARILKEKQENNPAWVGSSLYKQGKYREAIEQYKIAIEAETDPLKKASYYFSIASMEGRKLNQYSQARTTARKAANLRANWGKPYQLIGDLYAKTSRNCGKDVFDQQMAILAAVDKWAYAKSIDSDPDNVADANRKIAKYAKHKPEKGEGHMRGVKAGDKVKVGCWIGETVSARFQ